MTVDTDAAAVRVPGAIALAGVATFAVICTAAQFLRTDYDWLRVPLSFYLLGRYGRVVAASYFVLACGLVAFGIGWYRALDRDARSAAPTLLFVAAAAALCVTAAELTDIPGQPPTLHGVLHVVAANATFLCITVAMLLQSWRLRLDPRWHTCFRSAFALALIAFVALWIDALVKTLPRGLSEKVVIALILAWLWRAGWWLMRGRTGGSRRATTTFPNDGGSTMPGDQAASPDNTAIRTALWRALHVLADPPPHVFDDTVGMTLAAPGEGWRDRPDMGAFTRPFRASILARARFIEDLVEERAASGVDQYVILGAGLDTFAQRKTQLASQLRVFEIDQPGPQAWKRQRLIDLGFGIPPHLQLVPVDFEAGDAWWERLAAAGFDATRPAVVASAGVSMYLTRDAIVQTLRRTAALAPGSTLAMTFMLPIEMLGPDIRPGVERAAAGAKASGTPFLSFFMPDGMLELAREAGFKRARHVSAATLAERYFANRTDGLRPPDNSEELLVAET